MDITTAQKQYAQGFFDALRSVHNLNNFEFEPKKDGLFSPGNIVPVLIGDLASPFATTPTSSRELQAILQAMVSTPLGGQPQFPFHPAQSLPETIQNSLAPSTSGSSSSAGTLDTSRDIKPAIEIKQEPLNLSEDSPDTMSEHSRSSSVALSAAGSHSMRRMEYG